MYQALGIREQGCIRVRYTQSKDGHHRYIIYLLEENEAPPAKIEVDGIVYRVKNKTKHAVVVEMF